jgi:hypothetical protein
MLPRKFAPDVYSVGVFRFLFWRNEKPYSPLTARGAFLRKTVQSHAPRAYFTPTMRPSAYSEEIAEVICDRLANGESLVAICASDELPHRSTVLRWLAKDDSFATRCARARDAQADYAFDEMAAIEDQTLAGVVPPDVARVVLSSKQWRASKLAPKKYGDKVTQVHEGGDKPVQLENITPADRLKAFELMMKDAKK